MPRPKKSDETCRHVIMLELDGKFAQMVEDAAAWGRCSLTAAAMNLIEWGYTPFMAFFMDDEELRDLAHKRARDRVIND